MAGLTLAAGFTVLAIPFALVRMATGATVVGGVRVCFLQTMGVYLVGGVVGGAAVGALWPLGRSWLGRRFLGIVAALPTMFAVRVLLWGPGNWRNEWSFYDPRVWLLTAVIYGTVMSFAFEERRR